MINERKVFHEVNAWSEGYNPTTWGPKISNSWRTIGDIMKNGTSIKHT